MMPPRDGRYEEKCNHGMVYGGQSKENVEGAIKTAMNFLELRRCFFFSFFCFFGLLFPFFSSPFTSSFSSPSFTPWSSSSSNALWARKTKNADWSTGLFAHPFPRTAHSFACSALLALLARSAALIHFFAYEKVNDWMATYSVFFLYWTIVQLLFFRNFEKYHKFIFRCVQASLYEVVSVRPSIRQSVCRSVPS